MKTETKGQPKGPKRPNGNPQGTLGTFAGVFTPSILTILGIILFMRLGYVVGNAGLGRTLLILLLANGISVLTTVSLSAIATNLKVKGGGDYYLISRTLGLEFGGAIGIVLYLAQSVSIAFYCIGFGEVLAGLLPLGVRRCPRSLPPWLLCFCLSLPGWALTGRPVFNMWLWRFWWRPWFLFSSAVLPSGTINF